MAGLWAGGAPASLVERAVGKLDTCDLNTLLRGSRRLGFSAAVLTDSLDRMLARTTEPVPRATTAPDPSTRLRGFGDLPEHCAIELARDFEGFTLYGQFAWYNSVDLNDGIVFARDLYEENKRLLANYPGWDVWRYAPPVREPDGLPILTRVTDLRGINDE